jgi:hypothetical protein
VEGREEHNTPKKKTMPGRREKCMLDATRRRERNYPSNNTNITNRETMMHACIL